MSRAQERRAPRVFLLRRRYVPRDTLDETIAPLYALLYAIGCIVPGRLKYQKRRIAIRPASRARARTGDDIAREITSSSEGRFARRLEFLSIIASDFRAWGKEREGKGVYVSYYPSVCCDNISQTRSQNSRIVRALVTRLAMIADFFSRYPSRDKWTRLCSGQNESQQRRRVRNRVCTQITNSSTGARSVRDATDDWRRATP